MKFNKSKCFLCGKVGGQFFYYLFYMDWDVHNLECRTEYEYLSKQNKIRNYYKTLFQYYFLLYCVSQHRILN